LAAVLEARAGQADVCFLSASRAVCFPAEDGEGACAELAFGAGFFFEHLHERVVGKALRMS
jgi:hypothetical protein